MMKADRIREFRAKAEDEAREAAARFAWDSYMYAVGQIDAYDLALGDRFGHSVTKDIPYDHAADFDRRYRKGEAAIPTPANVQEDAQGAKGGQNV